MSKGLKTCSKEQFDRFVAGYRRPLVKHAITVTDPPSVSFIDQRSRRCVARCSVEWLGAPAEYRIRV